MLRSYLGSRTACFMLVSRRILFIQTKTITYETRIRRRHNDGIDLKQQTVEINPVERIRRCSLHQYDNIWTFYKTMHPNVKTLGDTLDEGCITSKDGPCLGVLQSYNGIKSLQWLSYSKANEQSQYIGSYLWKKAKLITTQSKVAILSSNRSEYLLVEQGCYKYGFIIVSLYTTYDSATILNSLERTEAEIVVIDNLKRIETIQHELLNNNRIKEILVMDDMKHNENSKIRSLPTILKSMKTDDICERPLIDPDSIATFILTSGTTGRFLSSWNK